MLDVYDEIEGYFNLLVERIHLIAQQRCVFINSASIACDLLKYIFAFLICVDDLYFYWCCRECPDELEEAASGILFAASRCGDFPEIQEIRAILTSRFGKEFTARAIELRNNCRVHPKVYIFFHVINQFNQVYHNFLIRLTFCP